MATARLHTPHPIEAFRFDLPSPSRGEGVIVPYRLRHGRRLFLSPPPLRGRVREGGRASAMSKGI